MRKAAISAGHSNTPGKDMGATGNGLTEGIETVKIRNKVKARLERMGVKVSVDPDDSVTGATVRLFKQYFKGKDVVIDIHLNAATSSMATGTEVIIPDVSTDFEKELAKELSLAISGALNITNRGVKTEAQTFRKKLLWMTIPAENILIECFFVSNTTDVKAYLMYGDKMCDKIAEVIYKYLQK
jgi:N-acetylmuramoyl-L-alanine amidase